MMSDLPANVRPIQDRHGKIRYRFRRKGWASAYISADPGTAEFFSQYAAILERGEKPVESVKTTAKVDPKSLDDLFARLKLSTRWKQQKAETQHVYGRILERFLDRVDRKGRRYGQRPVVHVTAAWLDGILSAMSDTPAAANNLRKVMSRMMERAIKLGWRTDNPVTFTDAHKTGPGFHTWTEQEIEQFRKAHDLGTMARLVLELTLNTAARRCNVATLTRDSIVEGRIVVDHAKGNETTSVIMLPSTKAALAALPAQPIKHLVTTSFGKPFTVAGLGNKMREWCDDAGLKHCTMHGLRKATSRRAAESGATDAEGQAITGHKKAETFAKYRAEANRMVMSDRAMSNLANKFDVQPE